MQARVPRPGAAGPVDPSPTRINGRRSASEAAAAAASGLRVQAGEDGVPV